jgi:hypothetical protein
LHYNQVNSRECAVYSGLVILILWTFKEQHHCDKMSTKLVRRLLQQTSDLDFSTPSVDQKHKKTRKRKNADDRPPVEKSEIIDQQVKNMLFLDREMANRGKKKNDSMQRIQSQQQRERKMQKKSAGIVLGNSRGASSQLRLAPEPTFDKKKYKKEKEEKGLLEIAKLLRKNSKKTLKRK